MKRVFTESAYNPLKLLAKAASPPYWPDERRSEAACCARRRGSSCPSFFDAGQVSDFKDADIVLTDLPAETGEVGGEH